MLITDCNWKSLQKLFSLYFWSFFIFLSFLFLRCWFSKLAFWLYSHLKLLLLLYIIFIFSWIYEAKWWNLKFLLRHWPYWRFYFIFLHHILWLSPVTEEIVFCFWNSLVNYCLGGSGICWDWFCGDCCNLEQNFLYYL